MKEHFGAVSRPRLVGKWDLGKTKKTYPSSKEAVTAGGSVKRCPDCSP